MKDGIEGFIGVMAAIAMLVLGISQVLVASMWVDEVAGMYWAIGALIVVLMFRMTRRLQELSATRLLN
jgi:tellurite resistance protein TehA-like permease